VSSVAGRAQTGDQAACRAANESMRCKYACGVRFMGTGLSGTLLAPPALAYMQDRHRPVLPACVSCRVMFFWAVLLSLQAVEGVQYAAVS
jgi:hypothetical protein